MSPGSKNNNPEEEQLRLEARKGSLRLRAKIVQAVRRFFIDSGYLEIETPYLIPAPPPEVHIDAFRAGDLFLHTSPELCMKRLLCAGYSEIFQICRCFRAGERGELHLPEFTLLEWYRSGIDYKSLMDECEELILYVSHELGFGKKIVYQGEKIDLQRPWERIDLEEAFQRYGSLSLKRALELNRFDEIIVEDVEPHLGRPKPTFLYDYPETLGAQARVKESAPELAERFEIYMVGLELANAFSELTDAGEQERRFERDQAKRRTLGKCVYPIPGKFLKSLRHMPASAGIALGLDRLVMLFADRARVDDVVAFTPEEL